MQNSSGSRPFLRRHPRLRRAMHRARASLSSLRRDGPGRGFPASVALLALLTVALLLTVLSGGSLAAPAPNPSQTAGTTTPGDPAASGAPDAASRQPTPTGSSPDANPSTEPSAGPSTSGATGPAASHGASDASGKLGTAFGKDCSEGTQGYRDLAVLRAPDALKKQAARFAPRLEALSASLSDAPCTFADLLLDPSSGTRALILAKNLVCAENLNGYFYFLFDPGASASGIAPLVLVVDRLFTDEDREKVLAEGTYATPEIEAALRSALMVLLGAVEGERASDFATGLYREVFSARMAGAGPSETRRFLELPATTVVFQDSYMTYVEFLPGGAP